MKYVCGSFIVGGDVEFRDYSDLEKHIKEGKLEGILLGEDARDFMSFYAFDVFHSFTDVSFRIGVISDSQHRVPVVCPLHHKTVLAIGMNNCVQVVDLKSRSVVTRLDLDFAFHCILCNGKFLAAIHELGAVVMQLSDLQEVASTHCDVVADATLSEDLLTLISMDEQRTEVNLASFS